MSIKPMNNKIDNLIYLISHSNLDDLYSELCEHYDMNLFDYNYFLYQYITQSKNINMDYETFFDSFSHDEINELYIDTIIQQNCNK